METNFHHPLDRLLPMASGLLHSDSLPIDNHSIKNAQFNINQYLRNVIYFDQQCLPLPLFPPDSSHTTSSQLHHTNLKALSLHYPQLWHDFQQKCQLMLNTMKVKEILDANLLSQTAALNHNKAADQTTTSMPKSTSGSQFSIKCLIDESTEEMSELDAHKDIQNTGVDCGRSFCFSESSNNDRLSEIGVCKDYSPLNSLNRFDCQNCQKSYSTRTGLQRHYDNHCSSGPEPKQFSCEHCSKVYHSLSALKMHIRTHTLPCKCSVCGKAFSRMWLLNGHLRTHSGEKPFCCTICDRAFADRSNLRAHLQTHTDIKKYECCQCKKTFSRMGLLTKHKSSNNCKRSSSTVNHQLNKTSSPEKDGS